MNLTLGKAIDSVNKIEKGKCNKEVFAQILNEAFQIIKDNQKKRGN